MDKTTKLVKLLNLFYRSLNEEFKVYYPTNHETYQFVDILKNSYEILPEHEHYIKSVIERLEHDRTSTKRYKEIIEYILELIKINHLGKAKEHKILQDSKDKLKQAGISFEKEDYTSTINNLNTSVELALKDELDIPRTINKINTKRIIDICISDKVGPTDYLKEIQKHVIDLDNKIKHQGYNPNKKDCINAMVAVEEFIKRIPKYPFKINNETKDKIYKGV